MKRKKHSKRRPKKEATPLRFQYTYELYKRVQVKPKKKGKKQKKGRKYRYDQVSISSFTKGPYYKLWVVHRKTKTRRLLAIGRISHLPIFGRGDDTLGRRLGGRFFKPLKTARGKTGKWVPIQTVYSQIEKEMASLGKDLKSEVRGAIIPLKRYYHPDWLIYSDDPISGKKKFKAVAVSYVVNFIYPFADWISKRSMIIDLTQIAPTGISVASIHKKLNKIETLIRSKMEFLHPQAEATDVVQVNGFIPLDYIPTKTEVFRV